MKKLLALEELAQFAACLYALAQLPLHYNYLIMVPAFFAPDLFAIGYLVNKSVGASCYNFSHHKATAIALAFVGLLASQPALMAAGLLAYAHSSFDRMIGYGLKYCESPNRTHLGYIGKEKHKNERDHF